MTRPLSLALLVVLLTTAGGPATAGAPEESLLERYVATYRFRLGHPASVRFTPGGETVLFLRSGPRDFAQALYEHDVASGKERVVLTASMLLEGPEGELSAEEKARRERMRSGARGIASYALSSDGRTLLVPLSGRLFVVDRSTGEVRELPSAAGAALDPQLSPDGTRVACVRDGELYVQELASGKERRLTSDATEGVTNGLAEFVAQEEMGRYHGFWWSPDSRSLLFQQTDTRGVDEFHIADPFRPERAPQPWPYPRPGRPNAVVKLGVVPVSGGTPTWLVWDRARYPYVAVVKWSENGPLTLVVQNRAQTEEMVLAVETRSGRTRTLRTEKDAAWLNIDQEVPHWLPNGEGFLWTTEREGDWSLEWRDPRGALVRTVVPVSAGLRGLVAVDTAQRRVYVRATGDPTETQLWAFPLDEGPSEPLTSGPAQHSAVFASDARRYVLTTRRLDARVEHRVFAAHGEDLGPLRSVAEGSPVVPTTELVRVAGEQRDYQCAVLRPRDAGEGARLPVVVYVYGGPHVQLATTAGTRFVLFQWLADQGFYVVAIDGRGTPGRGRDWERALKGDMGALPLADQVEALRALGRRFPGMDLERVGIFGWSYGGYMAALAALRRPDVFRAAVAVAPVVDWQDYDSHYTERYLGLPEENPDGYRTSSLLTYSGDLKTPLLLMHGTADDNVYFLHSLKLLEALFMAQADFSFAPLVGQTHSVRDPATHLVLYERMLRHFQRHLGK